MSGQYAPNLTNHNPSNYATNASFVYSAKFTQAVLALLDPQPGEHIVDLGCGTGELTRLIAQAVGPTGVVVGIDSSQAMLDKAAEQPSQPDIKYFQADIQTLTKQEYLAEPLHHVYDKVFSSATLHWCKADPGGVLETIKWLLKPGGTFVYEFGGFGNVVGVRSAFHQVLRTRGIDPVPLDPWYFPTPRQYEALLSAHGLQSGECALYPRPTPLPTGLKGWIATFARNTFLAGFDEESAEEVIEQVETMCRPDMYWNMSHTGVGVGSGAAAAERQDVEADIEGWELMYVRLRGKATFPGP